MERFTLEQLAGRLSLEVEIGSSSVVVERQSGRLELDDALRALEVDEVVDRHLAFCALFGMRLAFDRLLTDYVAGQPPDVPERHVVRYHEKPSIYGDRMPRILPKLTVDWFEALTGETAFTTEWGHPTLRVAYVLETGTHLHTLTQKDVSKLDRDEDSLVEDARRALFYDGYKIRPTRQEEIDGGTLRVFHSVEGLGASRAVLMPDFSYEAARTTGCFAVPSRDTLVVGRPEETTCAEPVADALAILATEIIEVADYPLSNMSWRLDEHAFRTAGRFGETEIPPERHDTTPALPSDMSIMLDGCDHRP